MPQAGQDSGNAVGARPTLIGDGDPELTRRRIAAAAGVSHQLITYHFGGKKGLYDALTERWLSKSTNMIGGAEPFAEIIREYVRWAPEDKRPGARTLVRAELDGKPSLPTRGRRGCSTWSTRPGRSRPGARSGTTSMPVL